MDSGRGMREMPCGWRRTPAFHSHRMYAVFICIANTFGYSENSTHFLLETFILFVFNLAEWMSRDISEERIWFLVEANHWNILICFSQSPLLQKSGFWESIKTKSLREKWGQGQCNTTWLRFSSLLVCGFPLTLQSRLIHRTHYILESEWHPVLGDSWVECDLWPQSQKWDLWGSLWKL